MGSGLTLVPHALGNYLLPVGTGELVAAVVLGALLPGARSAPGSSS